MFIYKMPKLCLFKFIFKNYHKKKNGKKKLKTKSDFWF